MGDSDATLPHHAAGSLPESPRRLTTVFREGDLVASYQIVRMIGRGGMGMVYEAMQEHPYRRVALKVMDPTLASPGALRRFNTEAQLLGRLDHEGIARIYEADTHRPTDPAGDTEPVPFFAMEFISDARPITEYAAAKGLDFASRLRLMAQVCDAVDHGHQAGVLHRDLKPENIVVDVQGRIKVIDFGIARVTEPELAATRITEVGQLVGTLQYMSPEQFDGFSDRIDARSDLYSLGIILYELVCNRLPYDVTGKTVIQAAHVVRESNPPAPGKLDVRCRGDIETIVLKAIHKDPTRRYQRAADMARDIRRCLAGEPIQARQDSMVYVVKKRTARWAGRKPELAILAVVALVVAATLAILEQPGVLLNKPLADARLYNWLTAGPIPKPLAGDWKHIRVATYTNQTDFVALARELGVEGIQNFTPPDDPDDTRNYEVSWRRVHGALMKKLKDCGITALAWDLAFGVPSDEYDPDFVAGADALKQARKPIDVILARKTWRPANRGGPENPNLRGHVQSGAAVLYLGQDDSPLVWALDLAVRHRNSGVIPSMAMLAYMSGSYPGFGVTPDFRDSPHEITLLVDKPGSELPTGVVQHIGTSLVEPAVVDSEDWDLRGSADVATFFLHMPKDDVLERASLTYEELVRATPDELRNKLGGKVLMIGQIQDADIPEYADHRPIAGTYANAAAVEYLFRGVRIRALDGLERAVMVAIFCVLGGALALFGGSSPRRFILLLVIAFAAAVFACILLYRDFAVLFNPLVPSLGMLASSIPVWQVLRLRRRQQASYHGHPSA